MSYVAVNGNPTSHEVNIDGPNQDLATINDILIAVDGATYPKHQYDDHDHHSGTIAATTQTFVTIDGKNIVLPGDKGGCTTVVADPPQYLVEIK